LAEIVISGSAAAIDFTSISQAYTHLEIDGLVASPRVFANSNTGGRFQVNGDSGAHYHYQGRSIDSATGGIFDTNTINATYGYFGQIPAASSSPSMASLHMRFPYYARTDTNSKTAHVTTMGGITEGGAYYTGGAMRFSDSTGVSRIKLFDDSGGTLAIGSRARLYGVT
jgi:hypothetical protein